MPAIINTNIASLNAQRNLNSSQSALQTSLQRLSSGLRINSAKDDAAGLAITERFSTQIRGLNQAARNANDGISLAQTGEGALASVTDNLQRIRELAVQAANSTNSANDRAAIQLEVAQRLQEIDRTAAQTSFNGQKLLDGSFGTANFQIGANAGEVIGVGLGAATNMRTTATGAVATTTSLVLGAGASGGSAVTGAITPGDFSVPATQLTAGSLTLNPATRLFGTAPVAFTGGSNATGAIATASAGTVSSVDFSVAGSALTAGSVSFTTADFNYAAAVDGKSSPQAVTKFDFTAGIDGYNSQVPTNINFSGGALAQFNVTNGTHTASITLTTNYADMTALAADLQTQVRAGGASMTTATVAFDTATGGLRFTNTGATAAMQLTNVDPNAVAAGFVASAGVTGAAGGSANFSVDTVAISLTAANTTITDVAAELTTKMQASALGATYSAAVVNGAIEITHAGSTTAVAIAGADPYAVAAGFSNSAGVAGSADQGSSSFQVDGIAVTLNQNYLNATGLASSLQTQLGANFNVTQNAGTFTIARTATGAASTAVNITGGDAASNAAGITTGGVNNGTAGTDLVATSNATFTVGAGTPNAKVVTLNQNYTDSTGLLNALQSQLAGYNVTGTTAGFTITSLTDSAAVSISGASAGAIAAGFANSAGTAGTAAVTGTNATFQVDGLAITLNSNFASYDAMATGVGGLQEKLNAVAAGVYTVSNNAGAITIAKVATGAASTAPGITVADPASTAAGLGAGSGTAVAGTDATPGSSVALTVDGTAITLTGNNADLTAVAGDLQTALDNAFAANAYTVSLSGTGLQIVNNTAGSAAVSITADNAAATTAGFGTIASTTAGVAGGTVTVGNLSINGTAITAQAYTNAAALATAINSTVAGVYAAVDNTGAMTLSSAAAMTLAGTDVTTLGLNGGLAGTVAANGGSLATATVATVADANLTIQRIDSALSTVSNLRSTFGAIQNRFESVISSLTATSENLTAARSRIQDTDFAAETAQLTRNQILQQAGTAMLAQANQLPNTVLSLLR